MENFAPKNPEQKFSSPQEELEYLRREVVKREQELAEKGLQQEREKIILDKVSDYKTTPVERVLHTDYQMPVHQTEAIVLSLSPEAHDKQIEELISVLQEKGIKNALAVLERMDNPHLYDDFHRFLVQYIKAGFAVSESKEKDPILKKLKMSLFEVSLPEVLEDENKGKKVAELISGMEQFYAGMISVIDDQGEGAGYFTLELANSIENNDLVFYVAVPDTQIELFEKQVVAIFPNAKISETKDDYNVFNSKGVTGKEAQNALDKAGITVNKNMIPDDPRSPMDPSGIRLGTPALTTRGMKEKEMEIIAEWIDEAITNHQDENKLAEIKTKVTELTKQFPLYPELA
jgi:hypothetical protein